MPRRLPEQPFAVEAHTQLQPRYDAGAWPVMTKEATGKDSSTGQLRCPQPDWAA